MQNKNTLLAQSAYAWLPIPVANSFTGVVRYKWDTKSIESKVSHKAKKEGSNMAKVEQKPHEFTEEERQRLVDFMDILIQIDQKEKARFARLKDEPNGFAMAGEGRDCGLCGMSVWDKTDGWFDKWVFKCRNCQDAVNKRKIPGSLCGDWRHKKSIPDTTLAMKLGVSVHTIRKQIREGKIIGRKIPGGPYMILRKDNPNLQVETIALGTSSTCP